MRLTENRTAKANPSTTAAAATTGAAKGRASRKLPKHDPIRPQGTERAIRDLEDATHRFSARRQRDLLPGKLVTRRLVLRALTRGDAPELARLANNRAIAERLALLPHPYGLRDALDFIEDFSLRPSQRPYAITLREKFVGVVGLAFPEGTAPELGYWLGEPYWGQGIATEAARALVDAALQSGQFERIAARALTENTASLHVLEKLGFKRIGEDVSVAPLSAGKPRIYLELRRPRWM